MRDSELLTIAIRERAQALSDKPDPIQERAFLTPEQAIALLPDGPKIHAYRNPAVGIFVGSNWDRADIINHIRNFVAEEAGPQATANGHGLAVTDDDGWLFIATCQSAVVSQPLSRSDHRFRQQDHFRAHTRGQEHRMVRFERTEMYDPVTLALKTWTEKATAEKKLLTETIAALRQELAGLRAIIGAPSTEISTLKSDNERLQNERARTLSFIDGADWQAMNERRAKLIDRDVRGQLPNHERAEYECLQLVSAIIVDLAHPGPPTDFEPIVKALESVVDRLKAENERLTKEVADIKFRTEIAVNEYLESGWNGALKVFPDWIYRARDARAQNAALLSLLVEDWPGGGALVRNLPWRKQGYTGSNAFVQNNYYFISRAAAEDAVREACAEKLATEKPSC